MSRTAKRKFVWALYIVLGVAFGLWIVTRPHIGFGTKLAIGA